MWVCVLVPPLFLTACYLAWRRYKKRHAPRSVPYKVLKSSSKTGGEEKRVCAVIGGTGFIGSHLVNELVRRNKYRVLVLGRKFRPERTNPDADCHIQVDMLDFEGLASALEGVDSVFISAAILPSVFMTADELYSKNRLACKNILQAAKKAGVKQLIHLSGIQIKYDKVKDKIFRAFVSSFYESRKDFLDADGENGLRTCAICPPNILGPHNTFVDKLISGEIKSCPMSDLMPVSFMAVEYLTTALANAEEMLATPSLADTIAGKAFPLRGEPMSWKKLFSLPGWPHKISPTPYWVLYGALKFNMLCAILLQWAPLGAELVPGILELVDLTEAELSEEEVQRAYKVLGVGPPHPPMAEYIPKVVQDFKDKEEGKKEK